MSRLVLLQVGTCRVVPPTSKHDIELGTEDSIMLFLARHCEGMNDLFILLNLREHI